MICRRLRILAAFVLLCALTQPAVAQTVWATVCGSSAMVYQAASTSSPHAHVPRGTTVAVKSVSHGWAKVARGGATGYMKLSSLKNKSKNRGKRSWKRKVEALEWFKGGDAVLKKGHYGYVYDIKSKQKIKVKRLGGHYHMDLEPVRKSDTAKLKRIGASWKPRPAILYADGKYIACSINTKPHGNQTVTGNGFDGQFCLHMVGSKTHGGGVVRGDHQSAIDKAYRWAHK